MGLSGYVCKLLLWLSDTGRGKTQIGRISKYSPGALNVMHGPHSGQTLGFGTCQGAACGTGNGIVFSGEVAG